MKNLNAACPALAGTESANVRSKKRQHGLTLFSRLKLMKPALLNRFFPTQLIAKRFKLRDDRLRDS
jgi:hypothetical protein